MRNTAILSICAAALLSGCASMIDSKLDATVGMSYEQLVASQSAVKTFLGRNCYRCDGQPTRTYTSKAGNKVAVYFYWVNVDFPRECDRYGCKYDYSYCSKTEEHFELVNNVVSRARVVDNYGQAANQYTLYSNACSAEQPYIMDGERNWLMSAPFDKD